MKYKYTARTTSGVLTKGILDAENEIMVRKILREQRLMILSIQKLKPNPFQELLNYIPIIGGKKKKVPSKQLVIFSRQFSTIVTAGIPIVDGLNILTEQIESKCLKEVLSAVKTDIESGSSISMALKKHPEIFSDLYTSMIESGETSGQLDVMLDRLAGYLEKTEGLKGKIKSALTYPMVILFFAICALIFMLIVVIPTFTKMFSEVGASLPEITLMIIGASDFLKKYGIFILIGLIVSWSILRKLYKTNEKIKYNIDKQLLELTILGPIIRKIIISRFTRTLATLIKSGVPILQALESVAKTCGNLVVETAVLKARESIKEGEKIASPLKSAGIFPPMVTQMISVGEETGNLEEMLTKVADFYEREVDDAVSSLTSLIEPFVILILGMAIGIMVVSMILPMFDLISKISAAE